MRRVTVGWIFLLAAGLLPAQIVLSRRDYAEHSRTFAQIWMVNTESLDLRQLTHSARDHAEPVCSRDGRLIYFVSDRDMERSRNSYGRPNERERWAYDRRTGEERFVDHAVSQGQSDIPMRSPDGTRIAAFSDGGLAILDAASGREMERYALPKRDAPGQDIVWAPDGRRLLAGVYGENGGSGDPQNDYFLLDFATRTWTPALTARMLVWLAGDRLVYLRPYQTTPLAAGSAHSVWTSQLAVYDLASRKDRALTPGLVLNDSLSSCGP